MPKLTPKSPELLQAQVAAFLAEQKTYYTDREVRDNLGEIAVKLFRRPDRLHSIDRKDILNRIGEIAASGLTNIKSIPRKEEGITGRIRSRLKPAVEATKFVDFLRSVGGSKYGPIQYRKEKLERFTQEFDLPVTHLLKEIDNLPDDTEHPTWMGRGSKSSAYRMEFDGKEYAVRVVEKDWAVPDDYLAAALLSDGIPHLEQLCAASLERGITVSEIMPGRELPKTTIEDMAAITDEQLSELVHTMMIMEERGISFDPESSNVFYDQKAGFGLIDQWAGRDHNQSLGADIRHLVFALSSMGRETPEAEQAHKTSLRLDILRRLRNVVESKLEEQDQETALEGIDWSIERCQERISNYLNSR